ncbi:MAG TPA: OsmC family protein [Burkholderiaceae bacterium]|nr:OsmC family protein [Burkholderiaceae bacterium]
MSRASVFELQVPLRQLYKREPAAALVTDSAVARGSSADDPFHSNVMPMPRCGVAVTVGVHRAIGGPHDAATPGDILCAALAACQDSSIRMVANILGITLESLEVEVSGDVDVRGTLAMDPQVPVGFQAMRCAVRLMAARGTNPQLLEKLRIASQRSCVVQQTLLHPPRVDTTFEMMGAADERMGSGTGEGPEHAPIKAGQHCATT